MTDRILEAVREIISNECPQLTYGSSWEYAVTSVNADGTVNGTATGPIPLPDLNHVSVASLACGGVCAPAVGTSFLVEFLNQDGTKVAVISCERAVAATIDATQNVNIGSTAVALGPSPSKSIARVGDSLAVFFPAGVVTAPTMPPSNITQIITPCPGIITAGAARSLA